MLLRVKGIPSNIDSPIVGKVTRNANSREENSILIWEDQASPAPIGCFAGILTIKGPLGDYQSPVVSNISTLEHLSEGDIVVVNLRGDVNTLYRVNSFHNSLLATERCNSNCLMCSQPPKDINDVQYLYNIHQKLIRLIPKDCPELGITGGEPTLLGELFFRTLQTLKEQLPATEIHILSNGRSFAWPQMAEKLMKIDHQKIMLGIPLYSDYYQVHDHIVQAKDAFNQTILGLHNLARYEQRIEIRIVLHKLSIPRLVRLSKFIYKNLPFAHHVTFMGLEHIGYTPFNIEKLWIDPNDYINELTEAVEFLAGHGMLVSIYNSQLCVLPEKLWRFCRKSISDWKNSYLSECESCTKRNDCGGLFQWNLRKYSAHLKPILIDTSE